MSTRPDTDSAPAASAPRRFGAPAGQPSARLLIAVALVPVAVLAVHEIRYLLAFGDASGSMLDARGHGYLGQLLPPLALICAVALGGFLARLGQAWQTGAGERSVRLTLIVLWIASTLGLLGIYSGQEMLEALISGSGSAGIDAAFGDGGAWALPAATVIGLLLALVLRGAVRVVDLVARLARLERHRPSPAFMLGSPRPATAPARDPMAHSAPGRAPPPRAPAFAFGRCLPAAPCGC